MGLRPIKFRPSYLPHAEGSCLISMGKTQVLCVASVEERLPPHAVEKGIGWVHAEYAMLPRAGRERTPRGRASGGGRVQEISRLIGRSLRAAIDLPALSPLAVTVDCDVIVADGGTRTASINGAFVALAQALRTLHKKGRLQKWPLRDYLAAVSVGLVRGKPILDLEAEEDEGADVDLNVVMTGSGEFVEVQGTAEGAPFSRQKLSRMLELAGEGIRQIIQQEKKVLGPISLP